MSRRAPHRAVTLLAGAAGLAVLMLAAMAVAPAIPEAGGSAPLWLVGAVAAACWLALLFWHEYGRRHFDDIRFLQLGLEAIASGQMPPEQLSTRWRNKEATPTGRLAALVVDVATRRAIEQARPDQRLAQVIAAIKDGVVVVTETGLISLVNAAAKALLGGERAVAGTSVFASLDRDSLVEAMARAAEAATSGRKAIKVTLKTVEGVELAARVADFGQHRGLVITITAAEIEHIQEVEVALDLHDLPPEAPPPTAATRLDRLPVLVLDTETTGLDVAKDSIVSVGAVRMHGVRIYRSTLIDQLVNPGRPIPASASAVHGITNTMVAERPPVASVLPEIFQAMKGSVLVGHNIGFDIALLKRAAASAGLAWPDPPWLDIILLAGALEPDAPDLNLDTMARNTGVNVSGRHTALGDSLVTAEIYIRMLDRLDRLGVRTYGEAVALSAKATHLIAQQKANGW